MHVYLLTAVCNLRICLQITFTHSHMHKTCVLVRVHICTHTHLHTHTLTYTHTHSITHTHSHTQPPATSMMSSSALTWKHLNWPTTSSSKAWRRGPQGATGYAGTRGTSSRGPPSCRTSLRPSSPAARWWWS